MDAYEFKASRVLAILLLVVASCSESTPSSSAIGKDADLVEPSETMDSSEETAGNDGQDSSGEELPPAVDTSDTETNDAETEPLIPPHPPETALSRWQPALLGNVLVTVDAVGLVSELLGSLPIDVAFWEEGLTPWSPVGIPEGLLCWDVDGDGVFDPTKEDFDGDETPSDADCALHPPNISKGAAGVVIALTPGAGCELRAYTLTGHMAWEVTWEETCLQPAVGPTGLLVPVLSGMGSGAVRLVDPLTGDVRAQVGLTSAPSTSVIRTGANQFAVGHLGGVTFLSSLGGDAPALFLGETIAVSDRPTTLFMISPDRLGLAVWRSGDATGSYGRRIRQLVLGPATEEVSFLVNTSSELWTAPVAGVLSDTLTIIAGGKGWVTGWAAETGTPLWTQNTVLGTVTGLALGGDARVYVAETSWTGDPAWISAATWTVWSYDPATAGSWPDLLGADNDVSIRWVSPPTLLCDLMVVQVVEDALTSSSRFVDKPCADGLLSQAWARPLGNNANTGEVTSLIDCSPGPGIPPCSAEAGCQSNIDCVDNNPCTLDSCVSGFCSYKFLPGCCTTDADCEDFDACTLNTCVDNACTFSYSPECCESSSECNDGNSCTEDHCEQGFCKNIPAPDLEGCCVSDTDCSSTLCTDSFCSETYFCIETKIPGCCLYSYECNDANPCTEDTCTLETTSCSNTPTPWMPGCCASDTDCNDDSICTSDTCTDSGECENEPIEDCCESKEDCNDGNECTFDACQNNLCVHVPTPNAEGCCATDEDCLVENDACILSSWCVPATATCEHDAVECDDGDPCTLDECVDGDCIATTDNSPEECCLSDADCDDQKLCTVDTCTPQVGCNHSDIPFCCEVDDDCNDDTAQTTDTCVANVCQYCEDFTFKIEQVPVDIVFVVDQSTSMTDKIDLVRTYLNDFAAYITTAGVDYHVLLVATRYQGENAICIDPPLAGENCKDSDTFRQINKQVGSHNGLQLVMENINDIEGFMRPNSQRQFVLISDDESDVGALTFDFFLIAQGGYDGYTFHSIIGQAIPSCATGVGNIYAQLSNGTGGLLVDICSADWTQSFQQLGDSTATASQSFPLTHPADVASLDVVIGGLPATAGFDYTYDAQSHRIILTDPLPPPDTTINVCYKPFGAP